MRSNYSGDSSRMRRGVEGEDTLNEILSRVNERGGGVVEKESDNNSTNNNNDNNIKIIIMAKEEE